MLATPSAGIESPAGKSVLGESLVVKGQIHSREDMTIEGEVEVKRRTSSLFIRTCAALLVSFAAANASTTVSGDDPATVLIMVNDATPPEAGTNGIGASIWVGQHYAAARGIPTSNIFHMN